MINISKQNESIVFEFHDNPWYLNDGTIECPVNSLTLVDDGSGMVTFMKAGSSDILCSAPAEEFGMTVDELVDWFKVNGCSAGGGSSISEIYVGSSYDTVDEDSGVVTKYQVGDVVSGHVVTQDDMQNLIYVYVNNQGKYFLTKADINDFLDENEFKSGTTVVNHVVRGVVDPRSEKVHTSYDASGNSIASGDVAVLSVNASGFTVGHIQDAINETVDNSFTHKAEYVWDSTKNKMVIKYKRYDGTYADFVDIFETNAQGEILLLNKNYN